MKLKQNWNEDRTNFSKGTENGKMLKKDKKGEKRILESNKWAKAEWSLKILNKTEQNGAKLAETKSQEGKAMELVTQTSRFLVFVFGWKYLLANPIRVVPHIIELKISLDRLKARL